jgi:AcrR family transcriptional regulator
VYSEPIPAQHPNATRDEQVEQAGKILARLGLGESTRSVAASMGISRGTLYARIRMITEPLPDVDVVRIIHYERLEEMFEGLRDRTESDASNADYARLVAEQRQVLARQSALLRVEGSDPTLPEPDEEPDNWVAGARDEADAELADVERELIERRNGLAS